MKYCWPSLVLAADHPEGSGMSGGISEGFTWIAALTSINCKLAGDDFDLL